jgi:hypothetical protein
LPFTFSDHDLATLFEQITAPIGGLNLAADHVRQGHFDHVVLKVGLLRCPIAE